MIHIWNGTACTNVIHNVFSKHSNESAFCAEKKTFKPCYVLCSNAFIWLVWIMFSIILVHFVCLESLNSAISLTPSKSLSRKSSMMFTEMWKGKKNVCKHKMLNGGNLSISEATIKKEKCDQHTQRYALRNSIKLLKDDAYRKLKKHI